jgi:magnesium-transporting ATPase (P-type)
MSEQTKTEASQASAQSTSQADTMIAADGPAQPEPVQNRKVMIGIIIVALVFVILLVVIILLLYNNPGPTAVIRDIFIIALAFTSFLIGLLMLVLIFQLQSLIALLRNEIKPMLTNANQTVSTVRGTAVFVSDNLVKPTIGVASFLAGLKGAQQAFMGKVNSTGKKTSASGGSAGARTTRQP